MTTRDNLFDHDRHCRLLDDASNELYRHGDTASDKRHQAMAGACSRASALHRQLQGLTSRNLAHHRPGHVHQSERVSSALDLHQTGRNCQSGEDL